MAKKIAMLGILGSMALSAGCAISPGGSLSRGWLYSDMEVPQIVNATNVTRGKMGKACASSILGIIGTGDAGIAAAAESAGIHRISYVDSESSNIWFFYSSYCSVVEGI